MEERGQAAILGIVSSTGAKHALTCYDIIESVAEKFAPTDPRQYRIANYVDSDDAEGLETLFLDYNLQEHTTEVKYRDEDWELHSVVLVSPPAGEAWTI